jgi:maltose alpha-D-glucosyltransferase/alpha-amylase
MYQAYAADPQMRINVGIRRRLAPLMENSRRRIELLNSLLMSMPGTPIIYYGDEIGMGDNIYLGDRNGVRTPMQWTGDRNAGFSRADPARLFAPPIMDPVYGYQGLNVEAQERSPFSLLNWMKRMIGLRKQNHVFGRGSIEFLPSKNRKVLAYVRHYEDTTILCLANLARSVQPIELDLSRFKGMVPVEMLGLTEFPRIGELPYFLTLSGYSFYWFRLQAATSPITAKVTADEPGEITETPALFMGVAWDTLLEGNVRTLIERDLLVPFLQRQRWFGAKARTVRAARFVDWGLLRRAPQPLFLTIVEVEFVDGGRERYFVPLTICSHADSQGLQERASHAVLANITGARKGVLFDGWLDDAFARTLLEALERNEQIRTRLGSIRAIGSPKLADYRGTSDLPPRRLSAEQSNTSIAFGDRLILKMFRRLEEGINPDFEIGRFLTERVNFKRVPALLGGFEHAGIAETHSTIGIMQELVESQGDGWTHATDDVRRFYDSVQSRPAPEVPALGYSELATTEPPAHVRDVIGGYLETAERLGRRTAEMHLALASDASDAAFAPEPFTQEDLAAVLTSATAEAQRAYELLEKRPELAPDLLKQRQRVMDRLRPGAALEFTTSKIRVHGDYHLGQVLWAEGDFYILDFEGEPARPLAARKSKQSPLKDVAGMMRSFSYAAHAGLFAHATAAPDAFSHLSAWAEVWETWINGAFLRGYFGALDHALFVPANPAQRDQLLSVFVLEKALYELNYELNNRADWLRIPIYGIQRLLD